MKKFISVLLLTAVVSTSVFAVPFNAALLNIENAAVNTQDDFDDFDVEGTELTESQMSEAEGEGLFGIIAGLVCTGMSFLCSTLYSKSAPNASFKENTIFNACNTSIWTFLGICFAL